MLAPAVFVLQNSSPGSLISSLLPFALIILVFYFFFIRPQAKKQKEQSKFIESTNKGDEVVLSSGIIGRINKIEDHVVTLQIDPKTFIRVTKGSISKEMTDAHLTQTEKPGS